MQTTATRIAQDFAARLRAELTAEEMAEVNRRNATAEYQNGACATHDFCDANMPMAEAFAAATGREIDLSSDDDARLWSAAWDAARADGFNAEFLSRS